MYSYQYAQIDQSGTSSFTDSRGEAQILPIDDPKCSSASAVDTDMVRVLYLILQLHLIII